MTPATPDVTLRSVAASSFLPALVYEIGSGAIAPILVLTASDLGASASRAALMLALLGIGRVIGDVPAAMIADRIGDRRAMIVAGVLTILGYLGCLVAGSLLLLGAALLLIGMANATFYLARQTYLIDVIGVGLRARAMSTLAGSHRIGLFIGPFAGAAAIGLTGLRGAYLVAMASAALTTALLVVVPDVPVPHGQQPSERGGSDSRNMFSKNLRLFASLGVAIVAVGAVRAARQTVLPLWAEHIGLSPTVISVIFGLASAVDMALFYPAGRLMDSHGRLLIAIPSMTILGGAMMMLPLTGTAVTLTIVAMTIGLGNGIGSGIMMTLGADAAPLAGRVRFLGIWRVFGDSGNAAGPVVVSVVAAASNLAGGIVAVGAMGLIAAASLARWVPRYTAFAWPKDVRAARRER